MTSLTKDLDEPDLFDRIVNTDETREGYVRRSAVLSKELDPETGLARYRYVLERVWDEARPLALWIMLNPSTADAFVDDPTIRRCVGFSRTYGMGAIRVINLFAYRATDPDQLWEAYRQGVDIVGPQNNELLVGDLAGMNALAGVTIVAWGAAKHLVATRQATFVRDHYYGAWCLGMTKSGAPKHPLFLASATALEAW